MGAGNTKITWFIILTKLVNFFINLHSLCAWMRPTHIMKSAESEEELKSLWVRVKEESEKAGLKFNIQKTKVMASGPITSQQIDRNKVKAVRFSWAPKSLQMVTVPMKFKDICFLEEKL